MLLIFVFSWFFWQDLKLDGGSIAALPDIVVENVDIKRDIEGRKWHIVARTAAHQQGVLQAKSIDLHIVETETNRETNVHAASGDFTQESSKMILFEIDGVLLEQDRSIDMKAPVASYDATAGDWFFPGGLELQDHEIYLKGQTAAIDPQGIFKLEKGARAKWKKQ